MSVHTSCVILASLNLVQDIIFVHPLFTITVYLQPAKTVHRDVCYLTTLQQIAL